MEPFGYHAMEIRSFVIVLALVLVTVATFFSGKYYVLAPVLFMAGFFCVSAVSLWAALRMRTRELLVLVVVSLAMASVDEYFHVSTGIYAYFDGGVPSPISVFGTGLLMIFITVTASRLWKFLPWKSERGLLRILPTLLCLLILLVFAEMQGYLSILRWPVILLYAVMGVAGVFYAYRHPLGRTVSLMISGIVIGATMEFFGSLEGMWSFHFLEPLPLFMIFVWALRTFLVHASCFLLGVDFGTENN
jgi:hypothetical protein